jgi:hypothetical protein
MERVRKLFGFLRNLSNRMVKIYNPPALGELLLSINNIFELNPFVKHYLFSKFFNNINMLFYNKSISLNSYRICSENYHTLWPILLTFKRIDRTG